jgi:integrase
MVNDISSNKSQSPYIKVANVPGLYRHTQSGRYYAAKKINGKRRERSLGTTDRQIAERRQREWVASLRIVDREVERTTLSQLMSSLVAANGGKSAQTRSKVHSFIKHLHETWPFGLDIEVRHIRPSHLDEWLAIHEKRLKNTSYNRYAGCLKQMFDIALNDRIIALSPFASVKTPWKRPQVPRRLIPTESQFRAIVDSIRSQQFTDHANDSANFVEFLGLAGLGQAEASSLIWGDVDWERGYLHVRRRKTAALFDVPIFPDLRPLLERLKAKAGRISANCPVFAIKDAKKSLAAACERLNYPRFSQRSMRQFLIGRLWKAGVDRKLIAKWQGHRDGGKLIMDTYTEVFGDDDSAYEQQQLAKLNRAVDSGNLGFCAVENGHHAATMSPHLSGV